MPPQKIDKVSKLASLDLGGISLYFKELLHYTTSDGVLLSAGDIEALVKAMDRVLIDYAEAIKGIKE